jgi:hypothetical protein
VLLRAEAVLLDTVTIMWEQPRCCQEVPITLSKHPSTTCSTKCRSLHWARPCERRRGDESIDRWTGHRHIADYLGEDQTANTDTFDSESFTTTYVDEFFAARAAAACGRDMLPVFILVLAAPTRRSLWAAHSGSSRTRASTSCGGRSRM